MSIRNTAERYGRVAQAFHWTTALLILVLLPMGVFMTWLPQATPEEIAFKVWLHSLHKTLGVTVFAIAIARVIWAIINPRPLPLHPERKMETFAAETAHWLLYAGIILAPLTGLLHHWTSVGFAPIWWPFGQDLPFLPKNETLSLMFGYLHLGTAIAMALGVGAHIAGAMKHVVIDKDKTVTRMLCGDDEVITVPDQKPMGHGLPVTMAVLALVSFMGGAYAYNTMGAGTQAQADLSAGDAVVEGENQWIVNHDASTLGIAASQLGSPVEGAFGNWAADISFDPDNLEEASVDVRIDAASLTIGTVSAQATGNEFLDSENFAEARFQADTFRQRDDGSYEAEGTLTIKDVTQPFVLPFALTIDGDTARMTSEAVVNRMDFGVGAEGYANEDSVSFEVKIMIELEAMRASAMTAAETES